MPGANGVVSPGDGIADEDNNHHDFTFMQLGPRVPAIVISPLIPKGTVDNTRYDHTSLLATLESFLLEAANFSLMLMIVGPTN